KQLAHSALFPELNHNEIVGWEWPRAAKDRAVVLLRDREDPPEIAERLDLTAEYVESRGALAVPIGEEQGGRLARAVALVQLGATLAPTSPRWNGMVPTRIARLTPFNPPLAKPPPPPAPPRTPGARGVRPGE